MQAEQNNNGTTKSDKQAHADAMSLPMNAVVSQLVTMLGATTVAVIGGVTETRAVTQWTEWRVPQRPNVLRFALQIATMIGGDGDTEIVRAWFAGSNPHLEDQVPMLMLRDKPLNDISSPLMAAARAFASRIQLCRLPGESHLVPPLEKPYSLKGVIDLDVHEPASAAMERRDNVIELVGDFDISSSADLERRIKARALSGESLTIDLTQCTYVDSTILAVLVRAANAYGDRLEILAPSGGNVARVLAITKLDRYLPLI